MVAILLLCLNGGILLILLAWVGGGVVVGWGVGEKLVLYYITNVIQQNTLYEISTSKNIWDYDLTLT